ncbi:MAG: bifunctional 4-hydroxy-2-oxoglutarate aldolase/2-dehydro-3-deoxy-phosphogluconate aldolase [Oscillospiraceae bacterium]|nr:bifunctional 4-hydroxy-2-oxoglutarate aldolase/2-dehydro-3-deoxy-phosphogluconate aldolase [Oscillospiraceae bacterium]
MEEKIIQAVKENKLIAIIRGVESETCVKIAQALYDGGFRLMEITYDQKHPEIWEETAKAIGTVAKAFEGRMYVGAGTVTCTELVELTHKYGGQFIISPDVNEDVIRRTRQLGMVSMPGALTPTEVMVAHRAGANFVKLFPAGNLGTGYVKAVKAPISHVDLLVVGGIDEKNVASFLAVGAAGAGIGGNLVNKAWVEAGQYEKITQVAKALVAAVK